MDKLIAHFRQFLYYTVTVFRPQPDLEEAIIFPQKARGSLQDIGFMSLNIYLQEYLLVLTGQEIIQGLRFYFAHCSFPANEASHGRCCLCGRNDL